VGLGARLTHTYTPPHETLAIACSKLNFESLVVSMVLAHSCMTFHPCTCGLCRGAAAVAVALIGYDDVKVAAIITREEAIMIDYFLYTDA
jgi:hypothetical protein